MQTGTRSRSVGFFKNRKNARSPRGDGVLRGPMGRVLLMRGAFVWMVATCGLLARAAGGIAAQGVALQQRWRTPTFVNGRHARDTVFRLCGLHDGWG